MEYIFKIYCLYQVDWHSMKEVINTAAQLLSSSCCSRSKIVISQIKKIKLYHIGLWYFMTFAL